MASEGLRLYREGRAKFYASDHSRSKGLGSDYPRARVFYNPRMGANRDISVAVMRNLAGQGKATAMDAMTASGVRAIRFVLEGGAVRVIANDKEPLVAGVARRNVALNGVSDLVKVKWSDASSLMEAVAFQGERIWLVDVDPFGSPALFIPSALRAVKGGGMVALTATDQPPLFGIKREKLVRLYGAWGAKTGYHKEFGLRVLIGYAAREAAKQSLAIRPVLAHVTRHYVRTYFSIQTGALNAKNMLRGSLGWILHCPGCNHREIETGIFRTPKVGPCEHCGGEMRLMGPVWTRAFADPDFTSKLVDLLPGESSSYREARRIMDRVREEANAPPLYYSLDILSRDLRTSTPSTDDVIGALRELGHVAVRSHIDTRVVKTNASIAELRKTLSRR